MSCVSSDVLPARHAQESEPVCGRESGPCCSGGPAHKGFRHRAGVPRLEYLLSAIALVLMGVFAKQKEQPQGRPESDSEQPPQAFVRRTVYWRRFWTWRDKLNQLKSQLQAAQQLRDQLLLAELRRSPIFAVIKRTSERKRWLAQRQAARVLQVDTRQRQYNAGNADYSRTLHTSIMTYATTHTSTIQHMACQHHVV